LIWSDEIRSWSIKFCIVWPADIRSWSIKFCIVWPAQIRSWSWESELFRSDFYSKSRV
jgi:hypothetical protein